MKRIAILGAILTVLLSIDGIYMVVKHYKPDDVNSFHLSDGGTVLVAAAFMLIVTVIATVLSTRSNQSGKSA